jgi:hypothetical protein
MSSLMRFAYIDSNGNEVPIPSVDALALRIELGAINEATELYDAQADQWGPAHTHEIFHTLSRAAEGDDGFVAPPPPVPPPTAEATPEREPTAAKRRTNLPDDPRDAVAGLTLADPPPEPREGARTAGDEGDDFGLDLAPPSPTPDDTLGADEDDGPSFDFGDMSGGLEMEAALGEGDEPVMDFGAGEPSAFGETLEQDMEFTGAGLSDMSGLDASGGLDLERPMAEFRADAPPAWMDPMQEEGADEVMDFSSISSDVATDPEDALRPSRSHRKSKVKPSPPRFRHQRSLVGPIVGVVVLSALGVGGYVAWPIAVARWEARSEPPEPQATLPPIPDRLQSGYRTATDVAFATVFREARGTVSGATGSPPREWLAGVYLANASRFGGVEVFWLGVRDQLEAVRAVGAAPFEAAFGTSMASAGIPAADRPQMLERARSGFAAAAPARAQTFDQVDDLVDAALELHAFLVANEDDIEYTPAATVTSDPVLEAKPATPQLGDAMADRIGRVTNALDDLDSLGLVTADGLWSAVLRRIQEVGIR